MISTFSIHSRHFLYKNRAQRIIKALFYISSSQNECHKNNQWTTSKLPKTSKISDWRLQKRNNSFSFIKPFGNESNKKKHLTSNLSYHHTYQSVYIAPNFNRTQFQYTCLINFLTFYSLSHKHYQRKGYNIASLGIVPILFSGVFPIHIPFHYWSLVHIVFVCVFLDLSILFIDSLRHQ